MGSRAARIAAIACLGVALGGGARAEEASLGDLGFARQRLSLLGGYGWGFDAFGSENHDTGRTEGVPLVLSWALGSDPVFDDTAFVGNFELSLELQANFLTQPHSGHGGGAAANIRYNWLRLDPVFWFIEGGIGIGGIDYDTDQPDGFNFIVQAGTGFHWRLSERWALTTQLRFHHFSNAGTRRENPGVNTHMLLVGPTYYFR